MKKQTIIYALIGTIGLSSLLLERSITRNLKKRAAKMPDESQMYLYDEREAYRHGIRNKTLKPVK